MVDWRREIEVQKETTMTFEDLKAWQQARQIVKRIYDLTRQSQLTKDFGLSGQIQRAGVSIMSNVPEGFERLHIQEKLQFYNVARGPSAEMRSLLYVVEDNFPSVKTEGVQLREEVVSAGKLVTGLIESTESMKAKRSGLLSSIFHLLSPC